MEVAVEKDEVNEVASKKKKSRNKYKNEDGKTLSRAEVMAMKGRILEGKKHELPVKSMKKEPKAKKLKLKTKNDQDGEPVVKKQKKKHKKEEEKKEEYEEEQTEIVEPVEVER